MNGSRENSAPRLPYLPALDGLRALAVLAVLLYHGGQTWLPGGFLGVEMFFVISGYLITSLLLAEWNQDGRVDFKSFWLRRARRLFPALIALLVVSEEDLDKWLAKAGAETVGELETAKAVKLVDFLRAKIQFNLFNYLTS